MSNTTDIVFYEEPQNAFMAYTMIAAYASLCGIQMRPWDQLNDNERGYIVASIKDLDRLVYDHKEPTLEDLQEAESEGIELEPLIDANVWYRQNWQIFPWGEPEPMNLLQIHHEFVLSVTQMLISMSGHYSTGIPQAERD